jgi:hypothetical protein
MNNVPDILTMRGQEEIEEMSLATTRYFCEVSENPSQWEKALAKWKATKELLSLSYSQ